MKKFLTQFLDFIGIKETFKRILLCIRRYFVLNYNKLFNKIVREQHKNYKSIPILIISFNQLLYLKQLIDFLKNHNYNNIIIIDNNSTYEPLLNYFEEIKTIVTIHRLEKNYGHLVFWKVEELFKIYSNGYYVITDADINPIIEGPDDFLLYFKKILDKNFQVTKVGFSLKIDDIPDSNWSKEKIVKWESKFWKKRTKNGNFIADIDTTFALYRPKYNLNSKNFMKAIRTDFPYQAKHGGWYIDYKNQTEEQNFYLLSCNHSSSWRFDADGKLLNDYYIKNP